MAAIKKDRYKGIIGSDKPSITDDLRDIADDLAALKAACAQLGAIVTANGTDLTTTEALANAVKTDINAFATAVAAITLKTTKV